MQCPILGYDFLSEFHAVIDVKNKFVKFSTPHFLKSELSPMPSLECNDASCSDILNIFPNVASAEFHPADSLLPVEHTFTINAPSFRHAARKLGPVKELELRRQIDHMLTNGIIEYSRSPYTSPVHLVPKKSLISIAFVLIIATAP